MRFKFVGNKGDAQNIVIRNNDANSLTLMQGAPCFYIPDATGDNRGRDVNSAEGHAAATGGLFAGFNIYPTLQIGQFGESIVFGFYDYARVLLTTRSDASAAWLSYSAIALGDIMSIVTTSGVQAVQRSAAGSATVLGWNIIAAQTLPSGTTQTSNTLTAGVVGNTTAMVTQLRVFVRAL